MVVGDLAQCGIFHQKTDCCSDGVRGLSRGRAHFILLLPPGAESHSYATADILETFRCDMAFDPDRNEE